MELDKYSKEIRKTGYVLENRIASTLKLDNWTVISNKYYEDDFTNSVREIDLLAYKVSKINHLNIYTTLLISCKKSESNAWALLTRDINLNDPNSDWWPLHTWSNDRVLQYQLSMPNINRTYHDEIAALGVNDALSIPSVEVFAFQEMDNKSGAPKNDSTIFSAVTSLMKAQAYELSALPRRKKAPAIYQFNLISINDSDLLRLKFADSSINVEQIDSEHYVARYIIRKSETFSRIRFIKASNFETALSDYSRLHAANCRWFGKTYDSFFEGVEKDWRRVNLFLDDFSKKIIWALRAKLQHQFNKTVEAKDISLRWDQIGKRLCVGIPASDDQILTFLNQDDLAKEAVSKSLAEVYRYKGSFEFCDELDIPF